MTVGCNLSMADSAPPQLLYLYGPPAVGKLTIGELVSARTGWPLFHNHLTIDAISPILPFGSPPFISLLHRVRLDVIETAIGAGVSLIFTNSSVWEGADGRERFETFASSVRTGVARAGGTASFVWLTAPVAVLEQRLANASRREHGKLLDVRRLHEMLDGRDDSPLSGDDLCIDTSRSAPDVAAQAIVERVGVASRRPQPQ
jgi:shikimate kinase